MKNDNLALRYHNYLKNEEDILLRWNIYRYTYERVKTYIQQIEELTRDEYEKLRIITKLTLATSRFCKKIRTLTKSKRNGKVEKRILLSKMELICKSLKGLQLLISSRCLSSEVKEEDDFFCICPQDQPVIFLNLIELGLEMEGKLK
jgi:hypothetical protein